MTATPVHEVTTGSYVHRYAISHWHILRPFVEWTEQDPKGVFFLADDVWDLWVYARQGIPSYRAQYRVRFDGLHSFLKPFVKWHCYQRVLQRPGDLRIGLRNLPSNLKRTDEYLIDHGYISLDDLAPQTVFEDLWAALLPPIGMSFTYHDVRLQSTTRPFWLHLSAVFGVPLLVPPVAPHARYQSAEIGYDERSLIPQPVIAQLVNKLALHRDGTCQLNRFHHVRLCVLLLGICLGRRIGEVLLSPRSEGENGPLTVYPAHGKGKDGGLWFRFEPNKDGRKTQVYISPAWHDLVRYCVKTILFYSDEVRHLASPEEQHLFLLVSERNFTLGPHSQASHMTQHDTSDNNRFELHQDKEEQSQAKKTAKALTYHAFRFWLVGQKEHAQYRMRGIFELWGITVDGSANGKIYHMRTQQTRHTRQSVLAEDATISPLTRQRDLNHTSRDMQLIYQHHLQQGNAKLREQISQHKLLGLGIYWLEQCLGLREPDAQSAFHEGTPSLLDSRWRALIVNNPQFVQTNRVSCGLCAFPQGPEGCPEFLHCTETTDEGCSWFLTDPNDVQMQRELHERANEHRAKQQDSIAAGRTVQARKYEVMAERTERLRDEALHKASDEVRQALLGELSISEEKP